MFEIRKSDTVEIFGTKIAPLYFAILNPTLSTQVRDVKNLPIIVNGEIEPKIDEIVKENVEICKQDSNT